MKLLKDFWQNLKRALLPVRCSKCGRLLFSPESRRKGIGPECEKGEKAQRDLKELERIGQMRLFD